MKPTALVTDACIMITFGNANALDLLTGIQRYAVVTTERVVGEVSKPCANAAVDAAVSTGAIEITSLDLDDPVEQSNLRRFDAMPPFRNRGDAEVLALAVSRGHIVCSSDRKVLRVAESEVGRNRVAGPIDVLIWSVLEDRISTSDADALLPTLDVGRELMSDLAKRQMTFRDLLN